MPDVAVNKSLWTTQWDWSRRGDDWSDSWGGTPALWFSTLLPRIHAFVPTGTILEIAPGYGRWTQYLKELCDRLILVDLAENCIAHCQQRFADASHIDYHVNDGRSLDMVLDHSVDLVFSFDSLVHSEADVMDGYLQQLARKLRPDGIGFIHHSNIGEYPLLTRLSHRMKQRLTERQFTACITKGLAIDLHRAGEDSVGPRPVSHRLFVAVYAQRVAMVAPPACAHPSRI
jgi:SAM-dependent methyltransferase